MNEVRVTIIAALLGAVIGMYICVGVECMTLKPAVLSFRGQVVCGVSNAK